MRILLIMNLGYAAGGAEKSVVLMKRELELRGHVVSILTTDKCPADKVSFADTTIKGIRAHGIKKFVMYSWYEAGRRQVKQAINKFNPDVIHIHTIGEFSPSILWSFNKIIPTFMTVHGPEGFVKKLLPWQLQPTDYRSQSYKKSDLRIIGYLRYGYFFCIQRPLYLAGMRRLRLVLAPSDFMFRILHADVPAKKLRHVYNGIELPVQSALPTNKTILFVGRVEAVKGIGTLIEAMKIVKNTIPDASLIIIGDGAEKNLLEDRMKQTKLQGIQFLGWVDGEKVAAWYQRAYVVVVPSVWPENLPTVAIEALGTGRPLVGSNVGGIPELIKDGSNGYVVEAGNVQAFADALSKILLDEKLAQKMGETSRKLSETFVIKDFIDRLEVIYEQ